MTAEELVTNENEPVHMSPAKAPATVPERAPSKKIDPRKYGTDDDGDR